MLACKTGSIETVELLLKYDGNINDSNILGDTPLKLAQKYGHDDLALLLIQKYKASLRPNSKK